MLADGPERRNRQAGSWLTESEEDGEKERLTDSIYAAVAQPVTSQGVA